MDFVMVLASLPHLDGWVKGHQCRIRSRSYQQTRFLKETGNRIPRSTSQMIPGLKKTMEHIFSDVGGTHIRFCFTSLLGNPGGKVRCN